MKEIPLPLIKANQTGIVVFVVLAIAFSVPLLIYALWAIQLVGLLGSPRSNLFIVAAAPLLKPRIDASTETQAAELAHFNQTLAVTLLTLSGVLLLFGLTLAGYMAAAAVAVAAGAALAGYCIGCTIYFLYKKWRASVR